MVKMQFIEVKASLCISKIRLDKLYLAGFMSVIVQFSKTEFIKVFVAEWA